MMSSRMGAKSGILLAIGLLIALFSSDRMAAQQPSGIRECQEYERKLVEANSVEDADIAAWQRTRDKLDALHTTLKGYVARLKSNPEQFNQVIRAMLVVLRQIKKAREDNNSAWNRIYGDYRIADDLATLFVSCLERVPAARGTPGPPGSLVLTKTEVSPPRDGLIGWGVKWQWAYTSTSATFDLTDIEDKPVVKRIHSSIDYALTFSGAPGISGAPGMLRPGDTVTVTINGEDTRTPIFRGGLDAYARQSGLEILSEKSCLVGPFNDGYHATCTGGSVYKVPPAATKVTISIWGNYGDPPAATYTWEKSR